MSCFQSFLLLFFPFFNAQRFGVKWWFTEALRYVFNRLQPTLAKIVVQIIAVCLFSLDLSWEKNYVVQLVQLPELSQLLADASFWPLLWALGGLLSLCVVTDSPPGPAILQVMGPSPPKARHSHALRCSPQRKEFCPDICPHLEYLEYLPVISVALSEAVPLY